MTFTSMISAVTALAALAGIVLLAQWHTTTPIRLEWSEVPDLQLHPASLELQTVAVHSGTPGVKPENILIKVPRTISDFELRQYRTNLLNHINNHGGYAYNDDPRILAAATPDVIRNLRTLSSQPLLNRTIPNAEGTRSRTDASETLPIQIYFQSSVHRTWLGPAWASLAVLMLTALYNWFAWRRGNHQLHAAKREHHHAGLL